MSDEASAQRAMAGALNHCTGGHGCTCVSSPSGSPSPASSSSRSGSASRSDGNSGNSTADTARAENSSSEDLSDGVIPIGVPVQEWSDLGTVHVSRCAHGRYAIMKKCWGGEDTGRRFLACPVKDVNEQCDFIEWLDDPWPQRVKAAFRKLWRELRITRDVQAAGHEALMVAYKVFEDEKKEKEKMKEETDRTKRVAEEMFNRLQRRSVYRSLDKTRMMTIIYCLIGVIIFLVAFIIFKM